MLILKYWYQCLLLPSSLSFLCICLQEIYQTNEKVASHCLQNASDIDCGIIGYQKNYVFNEEMLGSKINIASLGTEINNNTVNAFIWE